MIKKLFIVPWFGDFPEWMSAYREHILHLKKYGYEWYFTSDLDDFNKRTLKALNIESIVEPGTSRAHNYRVAYGKMFADILKGYDFWGITDLDCVYGNIPHFISDDILQYVGIHSNHFNYVCGPWTLFRNTDKINNLFLDVPNWQQHMSNVDSQPGRWTEVEYSHVVDEAHNNNEIRRLYTHFQGNDPNKWEGLTFKDGNLYDEDREIMMFHFNRHKKWPL